MVVSPPHTTHRAGLLLRSSDNDRFAFSIISGATAGSSRGCSLRFMCDVFRIHCLVPIGAMAGRHFSTITKYLFQGARTRLGNADLKFRGFSVIRRSARSAAWAPIRKSATIRCDSFPPDFRLRCLYCRYARPASTNASRENDRSTSIPASSRNVSTNSFETAGRASNSAYATEQITRPPRALASVSSWVAKSDTGGPVHNALRMFVSRAYLILIGPV